MDIETKYNISTSIVNARLNKTNVKRGLLLRTNETEDAKIKLMYDSGLTAKEIAKHYGFASPGPIRLVFKRNNWCFRTKEVRPRKYNINQNYFNSINTPNQAYILGFLYADGYNSNHGIEIVLNKKDIEILDFIKKELSYSGPINFIEKYNRIRLRIGSPTISRDLTRLGCYRKKSLTLKFPTPNQVSYALLPWFIRGYFDGDGYVGYEGKYIRCSFTSSLEFNVALDNYLKGFRIEGIIVPRGENKQYSELKINRQEHCHKFAELIYQDNSFRLKRKHDKFRILTN